MMPQAALRLADLGYAVFPCLPGTKRPATPRGLLDASTDASQVERWWTAMPDANIAIATGAALFVLDIDGADNPWLADQPERFLDLAAGAAFAHTPRRPALHLRAPPGRTLRNSAGKIAPAVDTRANGGYILVAPSQVNGVGYSWPNGELDVKPGQLAEPPAWLLAMLDAPGVASSIRLDASQPANAIPSGQRNSTLTALGGSMRRVGMSGAEILAALQRANADRCRPPLTDSEVETIANSVARYEPDQLSVAIAEDHWAGFAPTRSRRTREPTPARRRRDS